MSWSVQIDGSVEEIRQVVHGAETDHAQSDMPVAERMIARLLLGHAVEYMAEKSRGHPEFRWRLSADGHENSGDVFVGGGGGRHGVEFHRLPDAVADPLAEAPVIHADS